MRLAEAPVGAVFIDQQGNRWIRHPVGASLVVGAFHLVPVGEDLIGQIEGDVVSGGPSVPVYIVRAWASGYRLTDMLISAVDDPAQAARAYALQNAPRLVSADRDDEPLDVHVIKAGTGEKWAGTVKLAVDVHLTCEGHE